MANEITTSGVHFPNEYVGNVFKQGERPKWKYDVHWPLLEAFV